MRRAGMVAIVAAMLTAAVACSPGLGPRDPGAHRPLGTGNGYLDAHEWRRRQDGYLHFATRGARPGLDRQRHRPPRPRRARRGFRFDASVIGPDDFAAVFAKIDAYQDTSDFDMMRLMALWYGYRRRLHARPAPGRSSSASPGSATGTPTRCRPAWSTRSGSGRRTTASSSTRSSTWPAGRCPTRRSRITGETGRTHAERGRERIEALARREGRVGLLRVALGRLLRQGRRAPAAAHRVRRARPGPAGGGHARPVPLRPRPPPGAGQRRASRTAGPT